MYQRLANLTKLSAKNLLNPQEKYGIMSITERERKRGYDGQEQGERRSQGYLG
jgi:hypothetical protein